MNKKIYLFVAIIALACLAIESAGQTWTPPDITLTPQIQDVLNQLNKFICGPIYLILYISSGIAALLLILAGARYIAADDPGMRAELRRYMVGIIVGLVIVLLSVPVINFVIKGLLPGVSCEDINGSKDDINTIFCNLISALSTIGPWICALVVIYGGLRYLSSADDPSARKAAKTTLIAAFVGLVIVMLAIPLVNMVLGDALQAVECEIAQGPITEQIAAIFGNFLCIIALIAPPICALVVTYGGLRYVTSADDPGARDAAKTIIISALIGMILVMIAVPLVNVVIAGSFEDVSFEPTCMQGTAVTEITRIMCNFLCFFSYLAPSVCALVVIYGGLRYLVSGDDPGARRTARTIIISAFIGMIFVLLAIPIVNLVLTSFFGQVSCDCSESESVRQIMQILCKFICLIASIAPAISALVFILGGLRYVTSGEEPEVRNAAKTMIIGAIVGLILVMISLALVNIVVSGIATEVQCGCFSIEDPAKQISQVFCTLACTLQVITPAIAALVIIYGGLKYVSSAEDPSARAAARSIVINAIIGLIFVMLAIEIVNVVILNLVPTFRCYCAQVLPSMFSQLGDSGPAPACSSTADAAAKGPTWVYDTVKKDCVDKCAGKKCCTTTDQNGHPGCIGTDTPNKVKIFTCAGDVQSTYTCVSDKCTPKEVICDPICQDRYTCASASPALACTSAADAVAKGPTFVYDSVKKDCVDKCAGKKCCLTTDQDGHPGCIGTDTPNVVKTFACVGDVQTYYTCENDKCAPKEKICDPICQDRYTCPSASPDPGNLDLKNPEIK
jgi:hypothetical protein